MHTPSLAYLHTIFGKLAVLDLGVLALLIVMWCDMVVLASCKQQHENLIVAWESYCSSLAFVILLLLLLAMP
jgi:hypothetical protein